MARANVAACKRKRMKTKTRNTQTKQELGKREKQSYGYGQVSNKRPCFKAHFNEGLEG